MYFVYAKAFKETQLFRNKFLFCRLSVEGLKAFCVIKEVMSAFPSSADGLKKAATDQQMQRLLAHFSFVFRSHRRGEVNNIYIGGALGGGGGMARISLNN